MESSWQSYYTTTMHIRCHHGCIGPRGFGSPSMTVQFVTMVTRCSLNAVVQVIAAHNIKLNLKIRIPFT